MVFELGFKRATETRRDQKPNDCRLLSCGVVVEVEVGCGTWEKKR
jgi:hypothetical protein